jgi:hypothetical protein
LVSNNATYQPANTHAERRLAYEDDLERGKHLAGRLVEGLQYRNRERA